jgi:Fe-S cluster assembly ATPase SufC
VPDAVDHLAEEGFGQHGASVSLGNAALLRVEQGVLVERPDRVHVLAGGRIAASGGPELAHDLEAHGYDRYAA